jgi:hypothetical protein
MMHPQKYADLKYGLKNEINYKPALERIVGKPLRKMANPYAVFDFLSEDGQTKVELKSRTFYKLRYATTMIGADKVAEATEDTWFFFAFTDCLCWIKYDAEVFSQFERRVMGTRLRGCDEFKEYVLIPVRSLETSKIVML